MAVLETDLSLETQVQQTFRQGETDMSILGAIVVPHLPPIITTMGCG
jgi:hypothetical protein